MPPAPRKLNDKLGLQRAESAMRYLRDQHQIPLHKISVISYGPDKPVAPNKTKADRAQNRRIVINVLVVGPASAPACGGLRLPRERVLRPPPLRVRAARAARRLVRPGTGFFLPAPGR